MRMPLGRFNQSSGAESEVISAAKPETLKALEAEPALLMYEGWAENTNDEYVRYGFPKDIKVVGNQLVFRFCEEGRFSKAVVKEFASRLGIYPLEQNTTHWAIKDGGLPAAMLARLRRSYDVAFSFAGEDREYVEQVGAMFASQRDQGLLR